MRPDTDQDQLAGRPLTMRICARRERPHPGAQLSLFETEGGWRYSLRVTNLPTSARGWRANPAYADAAHRVHARVEDGIRTGKDTGIGKFPSRGFAFNAAWLAASMIAATLMRTVGGRPGRSAATRVITDVQYDSRGLPAKHAGFWTAPCRLPAPC